MNNFMTMANGLERDTKLIVATTVATLLMCMTIVATYTIMPDFSFSLIEFLAVYSSYICTVMCVFQVRLQYLFGMVSTALYSTLFFQSGINGLAIFNLYLVGSLIYGYFRWGPDGETRPVTTFKIQDIPNYGMVAVGIMLLAFVVMSIFPDFTLTRTDLALTVLSGVAQFGLDNKRLWNWKVWGVVNVISIYFFIDQGLMFVTVQYVYFLANAIWAYFQWKETMEKPVAG